MSAFDTIGGIFEGKVRWKKGRSDVAAVRDKAQRVIRGVPEVMVKISGVVKGADHVQAHLDYVSRNAKLELENERGERISGKQAIQELRAEWVADRGRVRKHTRDTTNIVLSMPPGTNREKLKDASRVFAKEQFGKNHQYVFVAHDDEKHPHVHLTVKNLGFDGTRLHIKRGDPQKWRELFAEKLRDQGVEAEATHRVVRGVVRKPVKQVIRHMRKRGKIPVTDQKRALGFAKELAGPPSPSPWLDKIKERHSRVRKNWVQAAKELSGEDSALAREVLSFVKGMPSLENSAALKKQVVSLKAREGKDR